MLGFVLHRLKRWSVMVRLKNLHVGREKTKIVQSKIEICFALIKVGKNWSEQGEYMYQHCRWKKCNRWWWSIYISISSVNKICRVNTENTLINIAGQQKGLATTANLWIDVLGEQNLRHNDRKYACWCSREDGEYMCWCGGWTK